MISSATFWLPRAWRSARPISWSTTGPRRTSGRFSVFLRTWRAPTDLLRRFPHPGAGERSPVTSATIPDPGRLQLARSRHPPGTDVARRYPLTDRGLVLPGYVADLALRPGCAADRSTDEAAGPSPRGSSTWSSMAYSRLKMANQPVRFPVGRSVAAKFPGSVRQVLRLFLTFYVCDPQKITNLLTSRE